MAVTHPGVHFWRDDVSIARIYFLNDVWRERQKVSKRGERRTHKGPR